MNNKLEKVVKLADAMYYAAQNLTTDASRLHKAMEDYHQFIINDYCKEAPANKDLEREIIRYKVPFNRDEECLDEETLNSIVYHFVDWQKQHDRLEVAKDKAKNYQEGFNDCRKQMMKDAIEGGCFSYKNGYVHISCDIDEHLTDIKIGDKVKVIIIKE